MLLEPLSINGKPQGKCFVGECKDCNFYRLWRTVDQFKKETVMKRCSWEAIHYTMPDIAGSIDGMQTAVNESRNRSAESKQAIINLGRATLKSFEVMQKAIENKDTITIEDKTK